MGFNLKRIVPVFPKTELQNMQSTSAHLNYNNGPLISSVQIFTIFWGDFWQQSPNKELAADINKFYQYIVNSSLIDQLHEYSTYQYPINQGSLLGTGTYVTPSLPFSFFGYRFITDSGIQNMLQQTINDGHTPAPTPNTLYCIYLPANMYVLLGFTSLSCVSFCGYHSVINSNIFYAVIPYIDCSGCKASYSLFDAITITSSHELCEAITDPIPGQGWYDQNNGEIGDICAWKTKQIGNYKVQLEWSNQNNSCV